MNGSPKSHQALAKACWFCTHPQVDGEDRSLLAFFATNSDFKAGTNSRPGNVNLEVALGLKRRAIQRRATRLASFGLLEITERGDGRGHATAYRVVSESRYFPDRAPGGNQECLIVDKPRRLDDADSDDEDYKPRRVEDADSDLNRVAALPETASSETETASSEGPKAPKPRRLDDHTPTASPKTPPPPPPQKSKPAEAAVVLENKYMATIGKWGPRNLEQLEALVAEHGVDTVDHAVAAAIADGGLQDVKSKSGCVLFRLPEKIAKHKADADAAIRKAKKEAAIARDIEFQTVQLLFSHHERWFDHRFLTTDADKSLFSKIKSDTRTFEPEDARALYERFQEWDKAQPKNDFEF